MSCTVLKMPCNVLSNVLKCYNMSCKYLVDNRHDSCIQKASHFLYNRAKGGYPL